MSYLWELQQWSKFSYNLEGLLPNISKARNLQGQIHGTASSLDLIEAAGRTPLQRSSEYVCD